MDQTEDETTLGAKIKQRRGPMAQRYAEFYGSSGYGAFKYEVRKGGRYRTTALRTNQNAHAFTDPATSDLVIGLTIGGSTPARWAVDGRWREIEARRPGDIGASPIGAAIDFDIPEPHELLVIAVDSSALDEAREVYVDDCIDILNQGHFRYKTDLNVQSTMLELWRAMGQRDRHITLLIDGLTECLIAYLVRMLGGESKFNERPHVIPLDRVEDFVRSGLQCGISISDLADLCDMPRSTFGRHFKKQTGISPYQFVQRIRIEQAKAMLLSDCRDLAVIALRLGFSDQSHFSRCFRQATGMTPTDFVAR